MKGLLRFGRSVRHTHARQLAARAWLLGKRHVSRSVVRLTGERAPALLAEPLRVSERPPLPIHAPRRHLIVHEDGLPVIAFLGQRHALQLPLDWHPTRWEHGTRLEKLHLHYMEWLEPLDDALLAACIDDWIRHNSPYSPGYWLDAWNSYAISIRCVVWMQQLALRHDRLPPAVRALALRSLGAQLRFLERNLERDIGGNHLIKNLKCLLWAARFFEGPDAERWFHLGRELLAHELEEQILLDGMHYERSPAYHNQVLADLLECRAVLEPDALRERLGEILRRMAQVTVDLTHPDGLPSHFNDGALHMTYAPAECMRACAAALGSIPHPRSVFSLPHAGYFGLRSPDSLLVYDAGPIGPDHLPAHAQGDIFSLEWSVAGERLIVDPGVYEYHAGPLREWSRSTRAHSTLTLDEGDQCEFYGAFRVGRRARVRLLQARQREDEIDIEAEHDGYARLEGAPIHRRRLQACPGIVHIQDQVLGGAGQLARARLLLPVDVNIASTRVGARLERRGVSLILRTSLPWCVERTRWCPDFGIEQPAQTLCFDLGRAPCTGSVRLERACA